VDQPIVNVEQAQVPSQVVETKMAEPVVITQEASGDMMVTNVEI
jgi:hypothetical protein